MPEPKRVGHKGADMIEPGNTAASFDVALKHGVDTIEFDVIPQRVSGRLVLAHDYEDATRGDVLTLEAGLEHLASGAFRQSSFIADLKLPGYELRVLNALRKHGLLGRSLISSQYPAGLARIRAAMPEVRLGWSVPRVRKDYTESLPYRPFALALLAYMRWAFPERAESMIRKGRCDVIVSQWRMTGRRLVEAVHSAGGEVYVWTVDDARRIQAFEGIGVDGIITNDPRLFDSVS